MVVSSVKRIHLVRALKILVSLDLIQFAGPLWRNNKCRHKESTPKHHLSNVIKENRVTPFATQNNSSFISNAKEHLWNARMKGKCNLNQFTNSIYLDNSTPIVSISRHILYEGLDKSVGVCGRI